MRIKRLFLTLISLCLLTAMLALTGCGSDTEETTEATEATTTETADPRSEAEIAFAAQMEAEGEATVTLDTDLTLTQIVNVAGTKTLTGSGKLTSTAGMEYAIAVGEGAALTIDGVVIDGEGGASNGIYGAAESLITLKSGSVVSFAGHGIRVLGSAAVEGGSIEDAGTNWVMVDEGAKLDITGGSFRTSGESGIITGAFSELSIKGATMDGAGANTIYNMGDAVIGAGTYTGSASYVFYNAGTMKAEGLELSGAMNLGYFENDKEATLTVADSKLTQSKADFIYNQGILTVSGTDFDTCTNTAVESKGSKSEITLTDVDFKSIGQHVILLKSATATVTGITCDGVGGYICSNRSGKLTMTDLKCGAVTGAAFYNELLSDSDLPGTLDIENFEIGDCGTYGVRTNIGTVTLKNGSFGKCKAYAFYVKQGTVTMEGVNFAGTSAEGRAVVQIGYSTYKDAQVTMTDCKVTGGARGVTNHANLTMTNCEIYGNASSGEVHVGGGISNDGVMTIEGGSVHDNNAASSGGGIYNKGTMTIDGDVQIYNNTTVTSGGGVANSGVGQMEIKSATIYGNSATNYGGGVFNSGTLTLSGGLIKENKSEKGGGGAENTGTITMAGGIIKNNTSASYGGGFYNGGAGTATLCGVTICGNKSGDTQSGGGVYNLGKAFIEQGTVIKENTAGTYGGGVVNSMSNDGTKVGTMTISGGEITGNTALSGGGGVYNRSEMSISGGTITGNSIPDGKNGKNAYSSGTLTVTGGTMNDTSGKPYDLYIYKGTLNYSGSAKVGSLYKGSTATVVLAGDVQNTTNYYMGSYSVGDYAFTGDSKVVSANMSKFTLPDGALTGKQYVDNNGRIMVPGVDPDAMEAQLWRGKTLVKEGLLSAVLSEFESGDVIKITRDLIISNYTSLSYFTGTEANLGKTKVYTIIDDGTAHTITIDTGSCAGLYIASSKGDGADGISDSGYYRTYVQVNIIGTATGGLTFKGAGEIASAGIYVSTNATLNVSGNVTFTDFNNNGTGSASSTAHATGQYAGAIYATSAATINIDGAVFKNNKTQNGAGGAIYASGTASLTDVTFEGNTAANANGGALYVTSTGVVKAEGCTFTGNAAVNGAGVYIYQNAGYPSFKDCSFSNNTITSADGAMDMFLSADATVLLDGVSMTSESAEEGAQHALKVQTGDTVQIKGRITIYSTELQTALTIAGKIDEESGITVTVPAADYTEGTVIFKGTDADAMKTAAEVTELTNTDEEATYRVGDDGKLYKYIWPNVNLLDEEGEVVANGTLKQIMARTISEGCSLAFIGDVDLEEDTEITGIDIDFAGFKLNANGYKLSLKALTITDAEADELTIDGTVTLEGSIAITTAHVTAFGYFCFDEALDEGSSLGIKVDEACFVEDKQIIVKDEDAVVADYWAAIDAIVIKNANPSILVVSKSTGCLVVDQDPNASRTRAGETIDGLFYDFMTDLQDGDIITLKKSINLTSVLTFDTNVTLKGEGFTISYANADAAISIEGATLTLGSNLTITAAETLTGSAITIDGTGSLIATDGVLTMSDITATAAGAAINNAGTLTLADAVFTNISGNDNGGAIYNAGTAAITGGSFTNCDTTIATTGGGGAVYTAADAVTTISGVTMTGCDSGYNGGTLYVKGTLTLAGENVITGGTVPAGKNGGLMYTGTGSAVYINGGTYAGAIYLYCSSGNAADLTITAGKFDCDLAVMREGCSITVSGGYYNSDVTEYIKQQGLLCLDDETGEYAYKVGTGTAIASIGETQYGSLYGAVEAALKAQTCTITLLSDITMTERIELRTKSNDYTAYDVILDLNGKNITLKSTKGLVLVNKNGKFTITGTGTVTTTTTSYILFPNNGSNAVIDGGTYVGFTQLKAGSATGTPVVTGGTFSFDPTSYVDTQVYDVKKTDSRWTVTAKAE